MTCDPRRGRQAHTDSNAHAFGDTQHWHRVCHVLAAPTLGSTSKHVAVHQIYRSPPLVEPRRLIGDGNVLMLIALLGVAPRNMAMARATNCNLRTDKTAKKP